MDPRPLQLPDAEGIALRVAHDREGDISADFRLDDRRAGVRQPLDLRLAVVGAEVEVDRIRRGPRLLAALKEKARAATVRRARDIEAPELALVHAGIPELLQ